MWRYLLVAVLPVLSGCVELSEEFWINEDGSGRFRMRIAFLSAPSQNTEIRRLCAEAKGSLESNPFVVSFNSEDYIRDGLHHFIVDVRVVSYRHLNIVHERMLEARRAFNDVNGGASESLELESGWGSDARFKKIFPVGLGSDDGDGAEGVEGLVRDDLARRHYSLTLHAPEIRSGNGTAEGPGTMTWKIPMSDVFGPGGGIRTLEARVGVPSLLDEIGMLGWAGAGVLTASVLAILHRRRRKAAA